MFATRLKEKRKSFGYSQAQAAEAIDIALSSYSAYETGSQKPRIDVLMRICVALDVSADWILGFDRIESIVTTLGLKYEIGKPEPVFGSSHIVNDIRERKGVYLVSVSNPAEPESQVWISVSRDDIRTVNYAPAP